MKRFFSLPVSFCCCLLCSLLIAACSTSGGNTDTLPYPGQGHLLDMQVSVGQSASGQPDDPAETTIHSEYIAVGEIGHHTHEQKQNWLYREYVIAKNMHGYGAIASGTKSDNLGPSSTNIPYWDIRCNMIVRILKDEKGIPNLRDAIYFWVRSVRDVR